MDKKIIINGEEINNFNQLSQEMKSIILDDNGNGIPDITENPFLIFSKMGDIGALMKNLSKMQGSSPNMLKNLQQEKPSMNVNINGKNYEDLSESEKAEIKAQFTQMKHMRPSKANRQTTAGESQPLSMKPLKKRSEISKMITPIIQEQQDRNRIFVFLAAIAMLIGYIVAQYAIGA